MIRVNPENPASTTDFVCDLCTEMPKPTDDGKTYTFKIRDGVKFHDGSPLTAADVAASWNHIIFPPEGVTSARSSQLQSMVDKVESPDPTTVVFRLKFATSAFLPALADPFNFIYKKEILDKDPHWYEKNILGSGPFKFVGYEAGQSIKGERNPDYYHKGLPYLDGVRRHLRAESRRPGSRRSAADRAAIEFRGLPPSARDELKKALGDKITVQESDWNCGSDLLLQPQEKAVRRRPGAPRADPGDRPLGRRAGACRRSPIVKTVGGIVFPGSPLAATKEELQKIAGFWPDIEKSRAEAKRLLKEAGAEEPQLRTAQPQCRPALQICRHLAGRPVEQDRRQGDAKGRADRPLVPGACAAAIRRRALSDLPQHGQPAARCRQPTCRARDENYGYYDDPKEIELYDKLLHETDPQKQHALMRRVREAGDGHRGARHQGHLVEPHRAATAPMSKAGRSARAIS